MPRSPQKNFSADEKFDKDVKTVDNVLIFCAAMKYIVAPINRAGALVPSDDKKFFSAAAKNILDTFGEEKNDALKIEHDALDDTLILTAYVQEFERRKRDV